MRFVEMSGRILLALVFLVAAVNKLFSFSATQEFMASKGMPATAVFLAGAIVVEIAGGLLLVLGFKVRIGALLLIAFLIPTTLIFHFQPGNQEQMTHVMKNLAILGGLLLLFTNGAGPQSLDARNVE